LLPIQEMRTGNSDTGNNEPANRLDFLALHAQAHGYSDRSEVTPGVSKLGDDREGLNGKKDSREKRRINFLHSIRPTAPLLCIAEEPTHSPYLEGDPGRQTRGAFDLQRKQGMVCTSRIAILAVTDEFVRVWP